MNNKFHPINPIVSAFPAVEVYVEIDLGPAGITILSLCYVANAELAQEVEAMLDNGDSELSNVGQWLEEQTQEPYTFSYREFLLKDAGGILRSLSDVVSTLNDCFPAPDAEPVG
jgi:hypothetical protein